jgi:hypothetical protein
MVNKYSVLLKFLVNSYKHAAFEFKGKIKFIVVTQPNISQVPVFWGFELLIFARLSIK